MFAARYGKLVPEPRPVLLEAVGLGQGQDDLQAFDQNFEVVGVGEVVGVDDGFFVRIGVPESDPALGLGPEQHWNDTPVVQSFQIYFLLRH